MYEALDKQYVLHSYAREYINFVRGESATLYSDKGEDYIDFSSGIGVVSVGHANKRVNEAICDQINKITHISNLFYIEPQAKLAEALVKLYGEEMRLFFANSGAEANEAAIKIARKYGEVDGKIKRYKIITLKNSFHGRTISTLKATGQASMHNYFGPFPDGFVYADSIDEIESLLDEKTVAVMVELVQGEGGVEPLDRARVQALAKLLKQRDILLIVDEVQTGVYRTGEFLAVNRYGIKADIVTLAKGLGGGVPIGAVMTRLIDIFRPGDHGSTFGGNYLVTRASLEVVSILEALKRSGKLDETIKRFDEGLEEIYQKHQTHIKKRVGIGLMQGFRMSSAEVLKEILKRALQNRVLVLKAGRDTLRFLPPLTISDEEMRVGFERLDNAFSLL